MWRAGEVVAAFWPAEVVAEPLAGLLLPSARVVLGRRELPSYWVTAHQHTSGAFIRRLTPRRQAATSPDHGHTALMVDQPAARLAVFEEGCTEAPAEIARRDWRGRGSVVIRRC